MKDGSIKEGDVFGNGRDKYLVDYFSYDYDETRWVHVIIFNELGRVKTECISPARVYDLNFLMNIADSKRDN